MLPSNPNTNMKLYKMIILHVKASLYRRVGYSDGTHSSSSSEKFDDVFDVTFIFDGLNSFGYCSS